MAGLSIRIMRGNKIHHAVRGQPRIQDVETGLPLRSHSAQKLNVPKRARGAGAAWGGSDEKGNASPLRHWALTDSRSSARVTLIILCVTDLVATSPGDRLNNLVLWRCWIRKRLCSRLADNRVDSTLQYGEFPRSGESVRYDADRIRWIRIHADPPEHCQAAK